MQTENILGIGSRVKHPAYGDGVVIRLHLAAYEVCFTLYGIKLVGKEYDKWTITEAIEPESAVTFSEAEKSLLRILRTYAGWDETVKLGDKWEGGTLLLQPADTGLKPKEMPIEGFFHKIVLLRDRLRVLEQRINSHNKLSESEKIELQQYITRIYGTLTSFNVLFKTKDDYFVGEKS